MLLYRNLPVFDLNTSSTKMAHLVLLLALLCPPKFTSMSVAVAGSNNSTSSGQIHLNCGASGPGSDYDGRTWDGDASSKFAPSLNGIMETARDIDPSLPSLVPYMTARIFMSNYTYLFPVNPGRMFIRLYFYPVIYGNYDAANALFSVTAGSLMLLRNFSASQTAKAMKYVYLVYEFSMNVTSGSLDLTFAPSVHQKSSFAFVNGIELVPTPDIFTAPMPTFVSGREPYPLPILSDTS